MSALNTDVIAERALGCWRHVARPGCPIELYVRVSDRRRIERSAVRDIHDAGVAVRAFLVGDQRAGFAACVGFSDAAIARAARMAESRLHPVARSTPEGREASERWSDLDPPIELPSADEIRSWGAPEEFEWIEAGTTSEALVGPSGWVAIRRRHRTWARTLEHPQLLVARRVTSKWDQVAVARPTWEISRRSSWVGLLPEAVAPIVPRLIEEYAEKLPRAWSISDEPRHPEGLVGGTFDDIGFETRPTPVRPISAEGRLEYFLRRSFRDPPSLGFSNLVLHGNDREAPPKVCAVASGSRLVALGPDDWVLELDLGEGEKRRVRSTPSALAASFGPTMGAPRPTADGPIVPGTVIDTQILAAESP